MAGNERSDFRKDVYDVVASIPCGKVLTYGQVAWLSGRPGCPRLVGRLLSEAADSLHLPCHRVVNSQGRTAPHWPEQAGLLRGEGVVFRKNGCVDMKVCNWKFSGAEELAGFDQAAD